MAIVGLIGGSGAGLFAPDQESQVRPENNVFGAPSSPLQRWEQSGHEIVFLRRHGLGGLIPPHKVNYRANLKALSECGATQILALNAVGGIADDTPPGRIIVPDQLIDYTWGREHSYYDGSDLGLEFIDFTDPYDDFIRNGLIRASGVAGILVRTSGTYGVTQGPRLETAAEINRMEADGCHIVGMTAMPEAALARELGLAYGSLCVCINWAAGRSEGSMHATMGEFLETGMADARLILSEYLRGL